MIRETWHSASSRKQGKRSRSPTTQKITRKASALVRKTHFLLLCANEVVELITASCMLRLLKLAVMEPAATTLALQLPRQESLFSKNTITRRIGMLRTFLTEAAICTQRTSTTKKMLRRMTRRCSSLTFRKHGRLEEEALIDGETEERIKSTVNS